MIISLKKETVDDISLLKDITGMNEDDVVLTAMRNFVRKRTLPITSTAGITFFCLAFYISQLINSINL